MPVSSIPRGRGGVHRPDQSVRLPKACLAWALAAIFLLAILPAKAQGEFGGRLSRAVQEDYRRSLVHVRILYSSSGVMDEDKVAMIEVQELVDLPGVMVDSKGSVLAWGAGYPFFEMGFKSFKAEIETFEGEVVEASLLGLDGRIGLVVLQSEKLKRRQRLKWAEHLDGGEFFFVSGDDPDWPMRGYRVVDIRPRPNLPEVRLLVESAGHASLSNSFVIDRKGMLAGVVTRRKAIHDSPRGLVYMMLPGDVLRQSFKKISKERRSLRAGLLGISVDVKPGSRLFISEVVPGKPAHQAGLSVGDEILQLDGEPIECPGDLASAISWKGENAKLRLKVARKGKLKRITAVLAYREPYTMWTVRPPENGSWGESVGDLSIFRSKHWNPLQIGLRLKNLTPDLARKIRAPVKEGVCLWKIEKGSRGADLGLKAGDIIVEVDGHRVVKTSDVVEAVGRWERSRRPAIDVKFYRSGKLKTLRINR